MSKRKKASNPAYELLPHEIEGFDALAELALDMHWYWNHSADEIWKKLDPILWERTYNPWVVLQTVSQDHLRKLLGDHGFRKKVESLLESTDEAGNSPAWFQQNYSTVPLKAIAYFSMEFMLSEALPIYSGGLGNVAGDQLKSASDLGVPLVGVGLLYQQGYFRQEIDQHGAQRALFPYNDPGQLPITPVRHANGEWLRIELDLPGYSVRLRAWQVRIGRLKLYLLDSNDPANVPARRGITSELYPEGKELRLNQELVLGIGGWRLLKSLGIKPEVAHLNEGHAAFVVLERSRDFMEETGRNFKAALAATRAGNLFTTHTAVDAGFDRFSPSLIEQYLGRYAADNLRISIADLLALGRKEPNDPREDFNMAYLAMRGSGAINAVSRLHGQVSRKLFAGLYPRWPLMEVPILHVTNGVHMASWDSEEADALWTHACGKKRWLTTLETLEEDIRKQPERRIWECRVSSRKKLIDFVRGRLARQREAAGASSEYVKHAKQVFRPDVLTMGFARRFATYKRPNLLLHDRGRLLRILTDAKRPVQLLIAGKAHPADRAGQALIQEWNTFIENSEARNHIVFLSDYDMLLTGHLVQGVDVWINTPQRPWEACGTSGMKVLVNGGLNISELDGWWAEAYTPEVGWSIGDGKEHSNDPAWDGVEANVLYDLLERDVIPAFYTRNKEGIPESWVSKMRESMAVLTPLFSANRAVREYTDQYYVPSAIAYHTRAARKGALSSRIVQWHHSLESRWAGVQFGELRITSDKRKHVFEIPVYLNDLDPTSVRVELYADGINNNTPVRLDMMRERKTKDGKGWVYTAQAPATHPATDYTPRIISDLPGVSVPLEANWILWQR